MSRDQRATPTGALVTDPDEQDKVQERRALSAEAVHDIIRSEGERELQRPTAELAWSGLAAGLAMGFSLMGEGLLSAGLPSAPWRPLVAKLGYALGFLIVILGRQQLFTENTLTPILPLLHRRASFGNVLRLWGTVLAANLVGGLAVAWMAARPTLFPPEVHTAFTEIGRAALEGAFGTILLRGVIVVVSYAIGLGGFLPPALLGNIVGGVGLVAASITSRLPRAIAES